MHLQNRRLSHQDLAVEKLAAQSQVSIDDVDRIYRSELLKLESGAHITGFLPILAIRKARDVLRLKSLEAACPL